MTSVKDKIKKLMALARDSGATPDERKAARKMAKKLERRVLLSSAQKLTGGWDDPTTAAYYHELKRQRREIDDQIVKLAMGLPRRDPDHANSLDSRLKIALMSRAFGIGYLMEFLDRVLLHREPWQEIVVTDEDLEIRR